MAQYIPKSRISVLEAGPGEFINRSTNKPYVGPYIELSSGKFYAGTGISNYTFEIVKPEPIPNNFAKTKNVAKYNILNKKIYKKLKKVENIIATKNIPTEEDYEKGFYTRYFLNKVNEPSFYIEVDEDTFKAIDKKDKKYNWPLYKAGLIIWSLVRDTATTNKNQIEQQKNIFPYLNTLFSNLNEFKSEDDITIEPSQETPINIISGVELESLSEIAPDYNPPSDTFTPESTTEMDSNEETPSIISTGGSGY